MTKDELTGWALANGWKIIGGHPSLAKPSRPPAKPGDAIVRLVLKVGVVHVEIRKPAGKWEKVSGADYGDVTLGEDDEIPQGLGLERIPSLSRLMQDNRDAAVFG
jgi:hypothetical protein